MTLAGSLRAADRDAEFVEALRGRGQHELVLEYLEHSQSSPIVSDEFKGRIAYEKGITLLDLSRRLPSAERRTDALDNARRELEAFAKANQGASLAAEAQAQLASVLIERAKQRMIQAEALPAESKQERETFFVEARSFIDEARKLFDTVEKAYEALLEDQRNLDPKTQQKEIDERLEMRVRLAQVRVLRARALYDLALTHPAKSPDAQQLLEQSAKELGELYEKYSRWPIGSYARLYEGQCYQALEQWKLAVGCFGDVTGLPDANPVIRKLITLAHAYQAACYNAQQQFDTTLTQSRGWLEQSQSGERSAAEWGALQFQIAEAARLKAATLEERDRQRPRLISQARDLYRAVSREPGEHQRAARVALAELGRGGDEFPQAKTFAEAYTLAKDALDSMNVAKLAAQIAAENNPDALSSLEQQATDGQAEARLNLRLALQLVDDQTELTQLNEVRYLLSWLLWEQEEYLQAAALASFVATRYPDDPSGAAAAKIALASFDRLRAADENDAFAAAQLVQIAQFIAEHWPTSDTAEVAFNMLLNSALQEDRLAEAEALVSQIAEERRPLFELKLANAMWERQLRAGSDDSQAQEREAALKLLDSGFAKLRNERPITPTLATAGLYLAQAYLDQARYQDAIALLEDTEVGPLQLLSSDNEVASRPAYAVEAHKAALRAYVSLTPPQSEKALAEMAALERAVEQLGGDGDGDRLTRIYVSLGLQLQRQIESFLAAGKRQEADALVAAFATFLDKLNERRDALDWATTQWISQTYFNLAEGLGDAEADGQQRRQFYERARDGFAAMIAAAESDASLPPSENSLLAARLQHAQSLRQLGEFSAAIDAFTAILRARETMLDVQTAAAETYREWGVAEKSPARLENSIFGGRRVPSTGQNRIWGWLKLAQIAAKAARSDPKYKDMFFEARLNVAEVRFLAAMQAQGAERKNQLDKAKQNIRSMVQLYPDLGGETLRPKYDALLKNIQREAGEVSPAGLNEFQSTST
ncbi:MAG: hypothetical protein WD851_20355 [Pirellulales bacterium]